MQIAYSVQIDAPKDKVWEILADFPGVSSYNPTVGASRPLTDHHSGVGAERHCDLTISGAYVRERVVEWTEGESYRVHIFDGKRTPPWKNPHAVLSVADGGDGDGTIASGSFEYEMKYRPVGALIDRFMVRPQFGKAFSLILAGLKHQAETGEPVDRATRVNVDAVTPA